MAFSQLNERSEKLTGYKFVKHSLPYSNGDWHFIYTLKNGKVVEQNNYSGSELTSRKQIIFDNNGEIIFVISLFDLNAGHKTDTIFAYVNKYDADNNLIERRHSFGLIESFSDFFQNSKPQMVQRRNEDYSPLYFYPYKEFIEYDTHGNVIREIKFEMSYPDDGDSIKRTTIAVNTFKYDLNGNVVELSRDYSPKVNFPIIMTGGLPLYQNVKYRYKYNADGLWTKKYWIIDGKKQLLERRKFIK